MAFLLIIVSWLFLLSLVLALCWAARLGDPIAGLTELDDHAVYSAWKEGTIEVDPLDQDFELYDYSGGGGQRELVNVAEHLSRQVRSDGGCPPGSVA